MKAKTNLHPENPNDCEYCKHSEKLVYDARKHINGLKATFALQFKPEDYLALYRNALVSAVRHKNHRMVKALSTSMAEIIKSLR